VERSALFGTLFDADKRRRDVQVAARELRSDLPQMFQSAEEQPGGRQVLSLRKRGEDRPPKPTGGVRVLSVYDHPPLLKRAFESARSRVMIVSPWIRANVVDQEFVGRLVQCLERGVEVTIAYGIGRRDPGERPPDATARESLNALSKSFPKFRFVRKGDTHAKVLLVDSQFFVTTSFNWLSFRGDPKQPMREEEGTMVEDSMLVEEYYRKLAARIAAVVPDAQSPPAT
jgi:phosphatidylserine/phosphatidylglycerophosphate/cardiolipin synthase-like enzyme